jgi:hypothetical protein
LNESVQTEKDIGRLIRNYDNKQNEGSRYSLLMTNYDFYDIYAILIAIRFKPQNECNAKIVQSVIDIISTPQNGNDVDSNIVRKRFAKQTIWIGIFSSLPLLTIYTPTESDLLKKTILILF